ncbi:MAG: phosphoserine transaminase [Alphaproteobacteria bacterium]
MKPELRPVCPNFSSGPCAKRPGWSVEALVDAAVGRSHRSKIGKNKIADVIERSKKLLGLPEGYRLGIVAGSDTSAFESALWSLLGERGVDTVSFETFGEGWVTDIVKQLKIEDVRSFKAPYGELPDLSQVDSDRDVVFTWNGTTSGVRVPNGDWIKDDRKGLTLCDATSAVFAMDLPWEKLDVVTYSWQKAMGGEAQHGILILSPRAVERLENYTPPRPLPKIFRLTKGGKLIEGVFQGATINTPSMVCIEDALDGLDWAERIGGASALKERSSNNAKAVYDFVDKTEWLDHFVVDEAVRSNTSVCFKISAPWFTALDEDTARAKMKELVGLIEAEDVGYDFNNHRAAPPSFRIWCGATIETSDVEALLTWIEYAYNQVK